MAAIYVFAQNNDVEHNVTGTISSTQHPTHQPRTWFKNAENLVLDNTTTSVDFVRTQTPKDATNTLLLNISPPMHAQRFYGFNLTVNDPSKVFIAYQLDDSQGMNRQSCGSSG
ncbi:hypothetical protein L484_018831 [Morus notabilis]|uniref:Uncharacterized protein n=1 Tax=Morus notabilis TaxID=981085 RepID=W9S096_9ROSA|nr:hypothetical protein L484_018831 [Morus notabilis]